MNGQVFWILKLEVRDGKAEALGELMGEMVEATKADEPGALCYEWFFSEDGGECHIYERYADAAAALVHLGNFGKKFAERFMGALKPTGMTLYGDASEELKSAVAALGAVSMPMAGGFSRS